MASFRSCSEELVGAFLQACRVVHKRYKETVCRNEVCKSFNTLHSITKRLPTSLASSAEGAAQYGLVTSHIVRC